MSTSPISIQGLPRSCNEALILACLAGGPRHGYQLALDLETRSGGAFRLKHGTLYPILHRLEQEALIEGAWDDEGPRGKRKAYRLVHGDLSPVDVLVGPAGDLRVDGVGNRVGTRPAEGDPLRKHLPRPSPWTAPESTEGEVGHGADVYSLAGTVYKVTTGRAFFDEITDNRERIVAHMKRDMGHGNGHGVSVARQ